MNERVEGIQVLRGAAAAFVMLFHIWGVELHFGGGAHIMPQFMKAGICGVDLFFVISGFVMAEVSRGAFRKGPEILRFAYNRVTRIYPAYWLFSLPALGVFLLRPELVNVAQGNRVDLVSSFLLLPQNIKPLLAVGWTLIHEMHFYAVLCLLLLAPERSFTRLLLAWAALVAGASLLWPDGFSLPPLARIASHPLTLEFIAGCLVSRAVSSGHRGHRTAALWAGAALLVGSALFHAYVSPMDNDTAGWSRVLLFGVPGALIVYGASAFTAVRKDRALTRFWLLLGDASYSLYLSHALTATAIGMAWARLGLQHRLGSPVLVAVTVVSCIAVALMGYLLFERPVMGLSRALYRGLAGGRTEAP
jgi:peptidoglycan/LPS O-acetylase OafA/YrhL